MCAIVAHKNAADALPNVDGASLAIYGPVFLAEPQAVKLLLGSLRCCRLR